MSNPLTLPIPTDFAELLAARNQAQERHETMAEIVNEGDDEEQCYSSGPSYYETQRDAWYTRLQAIEETIEERLAAERAAEESSEEQVERAP